jgi:hypothetical protein
MTRCSSLDVRTLRGKAIGRRAFVLANGPSVAKEDLSKLKGELVVGMNASTLLEKSHGFETQYYVLSDVRFITHEAKRPWGTSDLDEKTVRILRSELRDVDDQSLIARTAYVDAIGRDGFSANLSNGFYYGCTTTMLAIQAAFYLGCTEINLLGVDLRYAADAPRFYDEVTPQVEDAYTSVQISNILAAKEFCAKRGVELNNCSERSFLRPYLGYRSFDSFFSKA